MLFGISADGAKSHERFSNKFNLPFTLLSDEDNKVATYFGAYGDKKVFGKKTVGIIRSTYIIDEKGIIEQIWHPANASKNVLEVVNYLNK